MWGSEKNSQVSQGEGQIWRQSWGSVTGLPVASRIHSHLLLSILRDCSWLVCSAGAQQPAQPPVSPKLSVWEAAWLVEKEALEAAGGTEASGTAWEQITNST